MKPTRKNSKSFQYDLCLSFARENRKYVEKVAAHLRSKGIRTFYDEYERASLWGKDLYQHLDDIYRNAAKYCVLFISSHYAKRLWTNHERRSAQARAFSENQEYILPARFDSTPLPGLLPTVGYVNLRGVTPGKLCALIVSKIGLPVRKYYVPPIPNRLFRRLGLRSSTDQATAVVEAEEFVEALQRMSNTEKKLVAYMFMYGCPTELPKNIHMTADLLRRISRMPESRCIRELMRLQSLGFRVKISKQKHRNNGPTIELGFDVRRIGYEELEHTTGTIDEMIGCLKEDYCLECTLDAIIKGDFSALASATRKPEKHAKKIGKPRASATAR